MSVNIDILKSKLLSGALKVANDPRVIKVLSHPKVMETFAKALKIKDGKNTDNKDHSKTYGFALTESNKESVYMYMSQGELCLFKEFIKSAIPYIYGFK